MTKREVAILACRIMAVYVLVQLAYFSAVQFPPLLNAGSIGMWLVGAITLLVVATILWRKAGLIAAWIFGYEIQDEQYEPDVVRIDASLDDLTSVVVAVIGLWLVVGAVSDIIALVIAVFLKAVEAEGEAADAYGQFLSRHFFSTVIDTVLGIWLIFGSQRIVGWLRQVKNVGLNTASTQVNSASPTSPLDEDEPQPR